MTSARVAKGSPAHQTLQRQGWREDIEAPKPGEIWMNAPGRFRIEVRYETPTGARCSIMDALSLADWRPDGLRGFCGSFHFDADDEESAGHIANHTAAIVKRCTFPDETRLTVELIDCDESSVVYRLSLAAIIEKAH